VETELGEVPKGWRVGTLGDIADNTRRGIQPDDIEPHTPYIGLEHMPRKNIALADWDYADNIDSNKYLFNKGDILFGKLRPYFHKVGITAVDGVCSTDILVIAPKQPMWYGLVLFHISSVELVDHADATSTGTRMPRTNWDDLARFQIMLPPNNIAQKFTENILPLIQKMQDNILQSRTLAALRDALLPKLMSGEIRVDVK
jgi:type I restriction enzyme S subunit